MLLYECPARGQDQTWHCSLYLSFTIAHVNFIYAGYSHQNRLHQAVAHLAFLRRGVPDRKRSDRHRSAEVAACHGQGNAGDVGGLVRGQEQDCRRLLFRGAEAVHQAGGEGLIQICWYQTFSCSIGGAAWRGIRRGGASVAPGATPQTRMPCSAYSEARQAVIAFTPPLRAAHGTGVAPPPP